MHEHEHEQTMVAPSAAVHRPLVAVFIAGVLRKRVAAFLDREEHQISDRVRGLLDPKDDAPCSLRRRGDAPGHGPGVKPASRAVRDGYVVARDDGQRPSGDTGKLAEVVGLRGGQGRRHVEVAALAVSVDLYVLGSGSMTARRRPLLLHRLAEEVGGVGAKHTDEGRGREDREHGEPQVRPGLAERAEPHAIHRRRKG